MKVIVLLDDNKGMMFHHRKQSRDKALTERIQKICKGHRLWMNTYSYKLYSEIADSCASEKFMQEAEKDDFCLVEKDHLSWRMSSQIYSREKSEEIQNQRFTIAQDRQPMKKWQIQRIWYYLRRSRKQRTQGIGKQSGKNLYLREKGSDAKCQNIISTMMSLSIAEKSTTAQ